MLLAPPITWFYLGSRPTLLDTTLPPATRVERGAGTSGAEHLEEPLPPPTPTPLAGETTWTRLLVAFWGAGVVLLCIRLAGAWIVLKRLVGGSRVATSVALHRALETLRVRAGVARSVRLLLSSRVPSPLTFGWLRPVIVLPYSAVTGLPIQQLEAVLAHEIAHIQRHDYLIGVLQTLIETLLFYHPAVWWTSRTIRQEREHCCDEVAVTLFWGDAHGYAHALLALETSRHPPLALAARDGSLLERVSRLLGRPPTTQGSRGAVLALGVLLAFFGVRVEAQTGGCQNPNFPVHEGSSWTYVYPNLVIPTEETWTVTEVSASAFSLFRDERTPSETRTRSEYWHCSARGLLKRSDDDSTRAVVRSYADLGDGGAHLEHFATGVDLPNTPLRIGMRWESDKQLEYGPAEGEGTRHTVRTLYEVTAREKVNVPAGTFTAFRVDYQAEYFYTSPPVYTETESFTASGRVAGSSWYAEGVGLVKQVWRRADTNALQTTFRLELRDFVPAKEPN